MNKESLINLLFNNKEIEQLDDLKSIRDSIEELKNNVINRLLNENKRLKKHIEEIETQNYEQMDELEDNMRSLMAQQDRYSRRNNIEISGIPSEIDNECLEETSINILNRLDLSINVNDVEACHRLPLTKNERKHNKPKRTIIRFVNRKFCETALERRKKLKDTDLTSISPNLNSSDIFISDNLCQYDLMLLGMCRQLYTKAKIHACWSWKGSISMKINENDRPTKINNVYELVGMFPDFDFYK